MISRVVLIFFLFCNFCYGFDITLGWDENDPSEEVTGYTLYYGPSVGDYPNSVEVGNVTEYTLDYTGSLRVIHFVLTATNEAGESDYSNSVDFVFRSVRGVSLSGVNIQ
jgi:hypothetical protein